MSTELPQRKTQTRQEITVQEFKLCFMSSLFISVIHHLFNLYTGINQRWELLQAGAIKKDYRLSQQRQEWSQFKVDLENMMSWLDEAEALQRTHKPLPGEITKLDSIIRQHKVCWCQ